MGETALAGLPSALRLCSHRNWAASSRRLYQSLTNVETRRLTHVFGFLPNTRIVGDWYHVDPIHLEARGRHSTILVDPHAVGLVPLSVTGRLNRKQED